MWMLWKQSTGIKWDIIAEKAILPLLKRNLAYGRGVKDILPSNEDFFFLDEIRRIKRKLEKNSFLIMESVPLNSMIALPKISHTPPMIW